MSLYKVLPAYKEGKLAFKVSFHSNRSAVPACRSVFTMENRMPSPKTIYATTALATEHPALSDLDLKHGNYKALGESPMGKALGEVMKSEAVVLSLIAAQTAAPSRPPVVGIHRLLKHSLGEKIFEPDFKRLTGRYVRQILEHLGFRWKRSGVDVIVSNSPYASGSIYTSSAQ
jgi:hypothetical protein